MHSLGLTGLAAVFVLAHPGHAQTFRPVAEATLDLGGALLRQPGLAATNVVTAGAQLRYLGSDFALSTNGIAAKTPDDRFTGQGVLTASRYAPASQRLRWELTGTASGFGLSNSAPTFSWQGVAREHLGWSLGSVYVGAAGGRVIQRDTSLEVLGAHAGGLLRLDAYGENDLSAALAYTSAAKGLGGAGYFYYTDAIGYWVHRQRWLELAAGAGVRLGPARGTAATTWASGTTTAWMTSRVAIVVAAGRALEDVARGVPSVRYLALSVRVASRGGASAPPVRVRHDPRDEDGGWFGVHAGNDSLRVVTVRLTAAAAVELMADFTDWEPVPMTRMPNGAWSVERVIAPGTHRVAIRADGGKWMSPPNLPSVTDEFGGEVGIVIIP